MAYAFNAQPGEQYTIRRKVFKLFGAAFHVYDPTGKVIGFCKQKAFKLKEDIRLYADEACTTELFVIKARAIIDFSATYDLTLADGTVVGSFRRKGLASTFLKDSWLAFDPAGNQIATLTEEGSVMAFMRRYVELVSVFSPQKFRLCPGSNGETAPVAVFRTHFNPFVYRLSISVLADDTHLDDLMILAAGCLIAAIEGRQSGG
ncbi:hypothetical protein PHYC_03765 [Phycisphaerales bacterium]|nr:hypothetical protein PHYC_03765 [Phycisphaerales bacterium]